ncbi:RNA-directed DNA polymerase, eukaryota, reverse transcriptase zinc-binding domain protein [Tanacetum coccineum]|uniref:RNA-directed DNA polymerase, eukaryota, reverse transcriptase zinc-binding domain protein n=1 Tax=Tanacetum coccineum TaxID=301880 RepID=A0ABQ5B8G9_9ASTR
MTVQERYTDEEQEQTRNHWSTESLLKVNPQNYQEHPGCQITRETVTTDQHDELIKMGIKPTLKGSTVSTLIQSLKNLLSTGSTMTCAVKEVCAIAVPSIVIFKVHAKEFSCWIPDFVEDDEEESDTNDEIRDKELHGESAGMHNHETVERESDAEEVFETIFKNKQYQAHKKDDLNIRQNDIRSKDPFTIYDFFNKIQDDNIGESKMEGDECLQNIHDEKVASKVKKTCPWSNPKEDRKGSICSVPPLVIQVNGFLLNGEVVIMGDFNEVRKQVERYSSIFNMQGAEAFVHFSCEFGGDSNAMTKLMKKMKYLKENIYVWMEIKKDSSKNYKKNLKAELAEIHLLLDKGEGNSGVLNKRMSISKLLQELNKLESMEVAQKTKIKWVIEGDENLKYYHGILNKKRSQLAIRSILPQVSRLQLDMDFPNKLNLDQQVDLENNVTLEEIKRAVWDCGVDKSPFPDGFTFGFYRRRCGWIQSFLRSSRGSVIVNESPTREFQFHRGLKQGDPLSPFLFILIIKSLNILVQRVVDAGMFRATKIVCATLEAPFSYLWSKVGGLMSCIQSWNEILNNLVARLSNWKMKTVSIGSSKMKYNHCHFFNGVDHNGKKPIWVKWSKVLASKEKGGIHGEDVKLGKNVNQSHSSIWLDIVRKMEQLKNHDSQECYYRRENVGYSLRRIPRECIKQVQFLEFMASIEGVALVDVRNRWVWSLEGPVEFFIASIRRLIDDRCLSEVLTKTRWINVLHIKVNVHAWKLRLDCLPTRLNIFRRGMNIDSILCPICDKAVESASHIFFACHITREVFHKITSSWDVNFMEVSSYEEWL